MILWPDVLPQYIQTSGYSEQLANQMLRTQMDAGPAKVRRRFTAAPRPLTGDIIVTQAQLTFFRTWYRDVLLGGSLRFGWVEPFSTSVLTNLLTNGGFDSATAGWTAADCSLASIPGGIWEKCIEVTRTGGITQYPYQTIMGATIGNLYQATAYVKSGSSGDEACILNIYSPGHSESINNVNDQSLSDWNILSVEFTYTYGDEFIALHKHTATAGTMLFDQVSLVDITTGVVEMRFTEDPVISSPDGVNIRISMKLEILP